MKLITNWRNATVLDLESDGLLEEATKLHTLGYKRVTDEDVKNISSADENLYPRIKRFFKYHIDNKIPVVAHNGIPFDIRLVENLLKIDLSELMVIDTLILSWYLNHDREVHGLNSFFEDYGVAKPPIDDWENLSIEEYVNRVTEDVKINHYLWEDFKGRLTDMYTRSAQLINEGAVGGSRTNPDEVIHLDRYIGAEADDHIERLLTFLMFKMDCIALQEKTRWKVDQEFLTQSLDELNGLLEESQKELESVMPVVPKYAPRKCPAKMYKKNGELSASGEKWTEIQELIRTEATDDAGNIMVKIQEDGNVKLLNGYEPPNINSNQQIKKFLFDNGWEPENFNFVRDKEAFDQWIKSKPKEGSPRMFWSNWKQDRPVDRKVPQVSIDGKEGKELCPSVVRLAEEVPEIMAYSKYTTIKHRRDLLKGFQENMSEDGYLQASAGGLTNTWRLKHRGIVNLPGVNKPYGRNVRGALIAGEGEICLGSDLSSLEDRVKQHFMIPLDPEYVQTMLGEDYDPHLMMAVSADFITKDEMYAHIAGEETEHTKSSRRLGKSTNYAAVYNSGAATLARTAKIDEATAKKLLEGYWKLNWSVKAIAEEQCVFICARGHKWLINPLNGFCYSLRKESDRFSTLCQGTGSFLFDLWVDKILDKMQEIFKRKKLTGQFHDELIVVFKDSERNRRVMGEVTKQAIAEVSEQYILRRPLGCDIQYGSSYADIH